MRSLGELIGPTFYNGRQIVGLSFFLQSMRYTFWAIVVLGPVVIGLIIWLLLWATFKLTGKQIQFRQIKRYVLPGLAVLLLVGGLAAWLKIIPLNAYTSLSIPSVMIMETETDIAQTMCVPGCDHRRG